MKKNHPENATIGHRVRRGDPLRLRICIRIT